MAPEKKVKRIAVVLDSAISTAAEQYGRDVLEKLFEYSGEFPDLVLAGLLDKFFLSAKNMFLAEIMTIFRKGSKEDKRFGMAMLNPEIAFEGLESIDSRKPVFYYAIAYYAATGRQAPGGECLYFSGVTKDRTSKAIELAVYAFQASKQ